MKKNYFLVGFILMMLIVASSLLADGTEPTGNPRQVSTLNHLLWISTNSSSWGDNFIQTADIDASATSTWNSGAGFIPIGDGSARFRGSYDGDGHTISNLYINRSGTHHIGLFGWTNTATIENIGVENVDITGNDDVGGLVGYNYYSTVSNSYSTGSVSGIGYVGGLVGYSYYESTISNSYSTCNVARSSSSTDYNFGGFCGRNGSDCNIEYCYSIGDVIYDGATNPTNKGFCGSNIGTFTYNFFDSDVSNQSSGDGATAKTTSQMKTQSTFTNANWDFTDVWQIIGGDGANYPTLREVIEVPTTQASNIVFSQVYASQMDISWTIGNGSKRVVFAKAASSGTTTPVDGTTYTANATFGSGTQVGSTGWYCVYNGTGSSVSVTSLTASTNYIFQVFEYNGGSGSELYLTDAATNNPKVQATNTTPAPNYALDFDGTNDYVAVPANASLNMYNSSFTIETWVKCSETFSTDVILIESGTWQAGTYQLTAPTSSSLKVLFYGRSSSNNILTTVNWADGNWHHLAGVFDNANDKLILYMDGVKLKEVGETNAPGNATLPLYLGARGTNAYNYNGQMDEVRVWNVVRTQTEIQENMCKKLAGSESGLVAYYQMTNGSGTSLNDNSTNSNNGTLTNMDDADWVTSGAAIGDASIADYDSPSSVNLASSNGDDVTVGTIIGSPDGVQVYRIDGAPNVITPPGNLTQLSPEHYFGVFMVGGTTPTYTLTYNYEGHPGISNESSLDLAYRANNTTASWTQGNATLDQNANTLTLTGQSGTEYILGTESDDNSLPVELTDFTAECKSGAVVLTWCTESETENLGFIVERKNVGANHDSPSSWSQIASYIDNESLAGHGSTSKAHEYSYTDAAVVPGMNYEYRLGDVDYSGNVTWHKTVEITVEAGDIRMAVEFGLHKAYPNPFNPSVTLSYGLKKDAQTTLRVFNMRGQLVETLVNENQNIGTYSVQWQPVNLSTGVYIVRLKSGNQTNLQKVVFVK